MRKLTTPEQAAHDRRLVEAAFVAAEDFHRAPPLHVASELSWPVPAPTGARQHTVEVEGVVLLSELARSKLGSLVHLAGFDRETLERKPPEPIFCKPGGVR